MFPPASGSSVEQLLRSLEQTLANLRQPWPERWPGLWHVFEHCWWRLGHDVRGQDARTQALLDFGQAVSERIEQDGRERASADREPAYHNRLHMADALACMTHLLLALRAQGLEGAGVARLEALALAVMLGHDFMHPGGNNAFPAQLERMSVQALQPLMQSSHLHAADQQALAHCILMTDPTAVKPAHQAIVGRAFELGDPDWMSILAQEADILASTLPQTQQALTEALASEWQHSNPEAAAKLLLPGSRLMFLEHAALFSSPAAHYLGLNEIKSRQIIALQRQL